MSSYEASGALSAKFFCMSSGAASRALSGKSPIPLFLFFLLRREKRYLRSEKFWGGLCFTVSGIDSSKNGKNSSFFDTSLGIAFGGVEEIFKLFM